MCYFYRLFCPRCKKHLKQDLEKELLRASDRSKQCRPFNEHVDPLCEPKCTWTIKVTKQDKRICCECFEEIKEKKEDEVYSGEWPFGSGE